jgi:hypothetical protein
MRDLLLLFFAFILQPVPWLLPGEMTFPLAVWLVAFVVSVATLIWLVRHAIRVIRGGS